MSLAGGVRPLCWEEGRAAGAAGDWASPALGFALTLPSSPGPWPAGPFFLCRHVRPLPSPAAWVPSAATAEPCRAGGLKQEGSLVSSRRRPQVRGQGGPGSSWLLPVAGSPRWPWIVASSFCLRHHVVSPSVRLCVLTRPSLHEDAVI